MSDQARSTDRVPGWQLAVSLWAGIGLWMVHLVVQMGANGWMCSTGQLWPVHAVTVATALPTIAAGWLGWRIARRAGESQHLAAARFLGWLAVVMNAFSFVLIIAEWLPAFFVDPCLGA